MKVTIDGHHLDTDKASHHWNLYHFDGSHQYQGDLYRSSRGTWYVWTPSQWANQHSWLCMEPAEILTEYDSYLEEYEKAEIAELANLDWE